MIKSKTLLILGAGASVPYGYPTGDALRIELYDPSNLKKLHNFIQETGIEIFCDSFKKSQINSIDAFLARRGQDQISQKHSVASVRFGTFSDCGKLAIANQLIGREDLSKLLYPEDDNWLQYLWNHMSDVAQSEFRENQLKIISFNYDRVVEQYLQTAIEHSYGLEHNQALELCKSIEIVHVYGMLQDLEERPYGKKPDSLKTVAECIKVIPEARAETGEEFTKAKELINWAEKICFIGFGFDETNVERLGFPKHNLSRKEIYSTFYGKTIPELRNASKSIGWKVNPHSVATVEKYSSSKTLDYLRNTGIFL
jgi:hypothetical protein